MIATAMAVSGTIGRIMQVIASNTRTERGSGQGSEHKRELRRYHGRGRIAVDVAIGIVPGRRESSIRAQVRSQTDAKHDNKSWMTLPDIQSTTSA
jgi:hypothetical protein